MNYDELLHKIIELERQIHELEIDNQYADGLAYSQGKAKIREKYNELAKVRKAAETMRKSADGSDNVQVP